MSLVSDIIKSVAKDGEITHEFSVKKIKFVLRPLTLEELLIADGMIDTEKIRKKYGANDLILLNDTIQKHRTIALVALATKTVNGKEPIDKKASLQEQFKQLEEFRDELMGTGGAFVDRLIAEYNVMVSKEKEFYKELEENVEK